MASSPFGYPSVCLVVEVCGSFAIIIKSQCCVIELNHFPLCFGWFGCTDCFFDFLRYTPVVEQCQRYTHFIYFNHPFESHAQLLLLLRAIFTGIKNVIYESHSGGMGNCGLFSRQYYYILLSSLPFLCITMQSDSFFSVFFSIKTRK